MATSIGLFDYPFLSNGDFTSTGSPTLYRFVKLTASPLVVARATSSSNPYAIGVALANPNASGLEVPVRLYGTTQVYANADASPIAIGSFVVSGSDGQAQTQGDVSGSATCQGIALQSLSSGCGILIEILLLPYGVKVAAS